MSFSYPENWTLTEEDEKQGDDYHNHLTNIKNSNGSTVVLTENIKNSGMGGGCDHTEKNLIAKVEKLSDAKIRGFEIYSLDYYNNNSLIKDLITVRPSEHVKLGDVDGCGVASVSWVIPNSYVDAGVLWFNFRYEGDLANLSSQDKQEIIDILSSLTIR